VADFIGETNWLSAEVRAASQDRLQLQTEFGAFESSVVAGLAVGAKVWLGFRPETVKLGVNGINSLEAKLAHVTYLGDVEQYGLELRPGTLIKAVEQNPDIPRAIGATMQCHVRPEDCLVLPRTA
jgi:spermidine/putrescine transport system ATP-binding protein